MNEVTILAPNEVVEQLEASERLPQDIDPDTLRKYFTLTRPDLEQVDQCRGATNKLGFAVQLCTVRWRGHFLRDTREIPEPVLETLSLQLGVLPIPIDDYPQNEKTRAKETVEQQKKIVEDAVWAWLLKAQLLALKFRFEEADKAYLQAIDAKPDSFEANFNYGVFNQELNRFEKARAAYGRCLDWVGKTRIVTRWPRWPTT